VCDADTVSAGGLGERTAARCTTDQIGLLEPEKVADPRRKFTGCSKPIGFSLDEIQQALNHPDFDLLQALESQHNGLLERRRRLDRLIQTVELTMMSLKGEIKMDDQQLFEAFSDEQEKQYAKQAVETWGEEAARSIRKWHAYGEQKQAAIRQEGSAIYLDMVKFLDLNPESPQVQDVVARWHQHLRYFYEPSKERLQGLGEMYVESPDFRATFDRIHPELAPFMRSAIQRYCEGIA
jgi:DNA-binding transcriptional MerR regulator